jgi:hypothetical protein
MRLLMLAGLITLVTAVPVTAQEPFRLEVAGGYSWVGADFNLAGQGVPNGVQPVGVPTGWLAGVALFPREDIGVTAQFNNHTGSKNLGPVVGDADAAIRTFLLGVRLVERPGALEYFASIQGGWMFTELNSEIGEESNSALAASAGGGLDITFGRVGVRVFHGEIIFSSALLTNPTGRVSIGAFYRW